MDRNHFITWSDDYSVGHKILDRQHLFVVHQINHLYEERKGESSDRLLDSLFEALYHYTRTHFAYEEQLLQAAEFPGLEDHRLLHMQMTVKTRELRTRCLVDKEELTEELFLFLKDWWLGHILEEDFGYRPFIERE